MASLIDTVLNFLVPPLCGMIGQHCGYFFCLKNNLNSLREAKLELENIRQDVQSRVDHAEQPRWRRTQEVNGWLITVADTLRNIDDTLRRGDEVIQKTCLSKLFPGNWWSRDELGQEVSEKIAAVRDLKETGRRFDVFAIQLPLPLAVPMPVEKIVGFDSIINDVWKRINNEDTQSDTVIGLFGLGGVGKTTLLKKLNSMFLDTENNFELVIWVKVSRNPDMKKIQEDIRRRLEIPDEVWGGYHDEDGRAGEILTRLRGKKFLLLLDDVWERLDLSKLGVSLDDNKIGFKILFSSRSEEVCRAMGDRTPFRVECLSQKAALELFLYKVGDDIYNSNSEISILAQIVVDECQGLPLALLTIGHAMASRKGPAQWRLAIRELKKSPFKFGSMEKDGMQTLFSVLRFSYDSLKERTLETCFLYCSLFPEEHNIRNDELIQLWIGEGFLSSEYPRDKGEYIIESLKLACLLERGEISEDSVKMHGLIRDMALELASEIKIKTLVVQNHVGPIQPDKFDGWNEAARMSFWGSSVDFSSLAEAPKVRTLLVRHTTLPKLPVPSVFFGSTKKLIVLDLSYNLDLNELADEICGLMKLRHLNLSNTSIRFLPIEIKSLENLKVLLLDGIQCHLTIPEGVISSLSLLQVFSYFSTELVEVIDPLSDETAILKELEGLEDINDLSLTLFSIQAVDIILNSSKLQRCIRRLTIASSELSSLTLGSKLFQIETLHIKCGFMPRLEYQSLDPPSLSILRHISIILCPEIKDLTCLIHVPFLQFLSLIECHSLKEIIATDAAGTSASPNYFSNLMVANFDSLPSLDSICSGTMPFPCLRTISVINCPSLKTLPFNSDSAKRSLISIRASAEWWREVNLENDTKQVFAAKFKEIEVKR